MKFAVFLLFACLSVCCSANPKITSWGNPKTLKANTLQLGLKRVVIPATPYESKNFTLIFPEREGRYQITGIQHMNFNQESNPDVRFLKGGVGHRNVTIFIQRGQPINSTFHFYA